MSAMPTAIAIAAAGMPPLSAGSSSSMTGESGADAVGVGSMDDEAAATAVDGGRTRAVAAIAGGVGVADGAVGVADGVGCGVGVAVGDGSGAGVADGVGCGVGVAVGVGSGVGVADGDGCGDGVAVGVGSGVGVAVAVGSGDGAAVRIGSGVGSGDGAGVASGVASGSGVAVGVAAAACAMVIAYRLKFASVVIAHAAPSASVSQRWSSSVHASPATRYIRAMPSSQAVS